MVVFGNNFKTPIRINIGKRKFKFKVILSGTDNVGKYQLLRTSEGIVKNYDIDAETAKKIINDRYNTLHQYRRKDDRVVLYYNVDTKDIIILAVKPNDDLSKPPFSLKKSFVVTQEMLDKDSVTPRRGLVSITEKNLKKLYEKKVITPEAAYVLLYNKNNVGFYV